MQIDLTKNEYRTLLEMAYLADWMLHAHETTVAEDEYRQLETKLLSQAKDFECEDLVDYVSHLKGFYPSRSLEDSPNVRHAIDNYNDMTFWEELISKLANRDVMRQYSSDDLANMRPEERCRLFWDAESEYEDVFREVGLDAITVSGIGKQKD